MLSQTVAKDFYVIKGKVPVLFSAPHAHGHLRPTLSMSYKTGEPWSDILVQNLAKRSGAHGIYTSKQLDYDPNYEPLGKNEYKAEVAAIIRQMKIKYFFDLHGLGDQHQYDFGIFFPMRFAKSKKLAYGLAGALDGGELKHSVSQIFNILYSEQESLVEFVAKKLKIPAIQIEVARYIREDETLRGGFVDNTAKFTADLNI